MKELIIVAALLFVGTGVARAQGGTTTGEERWVNGSSTYCGWGNNVYQAMYPNGCTFGTWTYTGTMTYEGNLSTPFKQLTFVSDGDLGFSCTCNGQTLYAVKKITVDTAPNVTITSNVSSITLGQSIQLTASGASSYSWSGEGVQGSSGASTSALPTSEGVKNYWVSGYGPAGVCSDQEYISITVTAPITVCRDAGNIPLSSFGFNLAEGTWSGSAGEIANGSIVVSTLTNNTPYTFIYTRTLDNLQNSVKVIVHESIPGTLSASPTLSCETDLRGTIHLQNHDGNIVRWEQQNAGSQSWQSIENTTVSHTYQVTSSTAFRAIIKKGSCAEVPTIPIQVSPAAVVPGEINASALTTGCDAITGSLSLAPSGGTVSFWEKSYDGNNWLPITGSASSTLGNINETVKTWFRAATQAALTCPVVRSLAVSYEPLKPIPGYLAASQMTITCGNASGTLQLQNASTSSYVWQRTTGEAWETIAGATTASYAFNTTATTHYRVQVERNGCAPLFSTMFTANVSSVGGNTYASSTAQCASALGNVQLYNQVGAVVHWEHSTDLVSWNVIPSTVQSTNLSIATAEPVNYYRALVALGNCPGVYSGATTVTVDEPPIPGQVKVVGDPTAETINGKVILTVNFKLFDMSRGYLDRWNLETESSNSYHDTNSEEITLKLSEITSVRAEVDNAGCPPLLSGAAIVGPNKLYEGVQTILGKTVTVVADYEGKSYVIANAEGLSFQDGFSFIANSEQEFFVILDENYAYPPIDQNYVLEETILVEGLTSEDDIYFANAFQRQSNYTYFDGLARPMQKVARKASPLEKDVVVPIEYDAFGRNEKEFLPYVSFGSDGMLKDYAVEDQAMFYVSPPEKVASSAHPFAVKVYEPSPLNRVVEQGSPGTDWQPAIGHTVRTKFGSNATGEVPLWRINYETGMPERDGFYSAHELYVVETIDEHGSTVKQFTDMQGQLLEKHVQLGNSWLRTVYIFDDFGLLRFVVQPEGVANLPEEITQTFLDTWTFQYRYDERQRIIEKRVPGSGWNYMVYDNRDRLVLTQDANQHENNDWTFTKYDALNRPVVNGIYHWADPLLPDKKISRNEMAGLISTTSFAEQRENNNNFFGYSNTIFPIQYLNVNSVTYYDDYSFLNTSSFPNVAFDKNALSGLPDEPFNRVKGLVTGTLTKVEDGGNTFLHAVNWYDDNYRVIQTFSTNHLGGHDRISSRYDFVGKVLSRSHIHTTAAGETHTLGEQFTYDHAGRLLQQKHKIDNQSTVTLKEINYNAIGQMVESNLHLKEDGDYEQSVDYRYNIRGWLTHINNATLTHDGGATNDEGNDFFGFELKYQNPDRSTANYNGNISEVNWKMLGSSRQAFDYTYDKANRLKNAVYKDMEDPLRNGRFNESISAYDANGNIKGLTRTGNILENEPLYGNIDALIYDYEGNRLKRVTDNLPGGFEDRNKRSDDYTYDANGNMTADKNKEIATIAFNTLNLPMVVTKTNGDHINYTYTASGVKLSQLAVEGETEKRTDYAGPFVYENNFLQFIQHPEGRITMIGTPVYEYFLKDHLGNVRVTFTTKKEVEEARASMEDHRVQEERSKFLNYDHVRKLYSSIFNKSDYYTPGYAVRLSGGPEEQTGLARSLQVMPGDKVHMEVYAKYTHPDDETYWGYFVQQALGALASLPSPLVVDGPGYGTPGYVPLPAEGSPASEDYDGPQAYLRYFFIPKDFDFTGLIGDGVKLSAEPRELGNNTPHEKLELDFEATQPGFLYVYFCNDREEPLEEVFFDEFLVEHEKSAIVQSNDYYPFGLTFNSYSRENSTQQNYRYNGKEIQHELNLGWYDYGARMYDAAIARWVGVDPLADKYKKVSPYVYTINNPLRYIDPDGMRIRGVHRDEHGNIRYSRWAERNGTKTVIEAMRKTETGIAQVNMLIDKKEKVKIQLTDKLLVQKDKDGNYGQVQGDASQSNNVVTISTAGMDGTAVDLKNAYRVTPEGLIVKEDAVNSENAKSAEGQQYADMPPTGSVEGEINATAVHEAEHLTDENKETAKTNPSKKEEKPKQKEEQTRKEWNSKHNEQ